MHDLVVSVKEGLHACGRGFHFHTKGPGREQSLDTNMRRWGLLSRAVSLHRDTGPLCVCFLLVQWAEFLLANFRGLLWALSPTTVMELYFLDCKLHRNILTTLSDRKLRSHFYLSHSSFSLLWGGRKEHSLLQLWSSRILSGMSW